MTRVPLVLNEFFGQRRTWIHRLHLKYGPVVRIAPDEVSFATREASKEIYSSGGSGYDKTAAYELFSHYDTPNAFSTLEKALHAELKRRFAERYNKTHILRPEVISIVEDVVETFVAKCTENAGCAVDIYALLHCYSLDGVTGHMFSPNGLRSLTEPRDFAMMKQLTYPSLSKEQYLRYYFPFFERMISLVLGKAEVAPHTLAHKLRLYQSVNPDLKLAASECMDHLVAGLDTTGDALCFLMHYLSLPASRLLQERLHVELASSPSAPIDDFPYLDALVKEGLRVLGPVPMSLPQLVPSGGSIIDDVHLPRGTIVSCQSYMLHRLDGALYGSDESRGT
ncbi:cytochrome P450 [Trametes meyenii]|nr:cytochrome P450 [Trametes meyenii]